LADVENTSDYSRVEESVYSYACDDMMWRDVSLFLFNNDKRVSKYMFSST